ncbi:Arylsulfatase I [Frankliniella fusca]|uniref:Arylsulfatase I n=1 Tax=Frankliniella fusca TaxID=407009 RepID=A0AAE1HKB4_9NEOP|nr:Arylsulfatase I [Frankliniella fusca]
MDRARRSRPSVVALAALGSLLLASPPMAAALSTVSAPLGPSGPPPGHTAATPPGASASEPTSAAALPTTTSTTAAPSTSGPSPISPLDSNRVPEQRAGPRPRPAPASRDKPNIIFILADDLGWNDVGFHGSNQIPTPNLDALAYSGLILNNYYVTPICTPTRAALMTGKYPIHTGMQHTVLFGAEPRGLPLSEVLLPQYLHARGYDCRIVGKWHLGHFRREYTPTHRGFRSHLGPWTGHHDYFDHTAVEKSYWGLDMRRDLRPAWDLHGRYSTDAFTEEAERIIGAHNASEPLFLYLAHVAPHSGNPYNPLPAHDKDVAKHDIIPDYNRRRYAAMVHRVDESVGRVVDALRKRNMLRNSVIVFSTDNGGPAEGFNLNAASNWPLRGVKHTLWEGGVRGAGLLWSPLLARPGRVSRQLMHVTDWLPTLVRVAGGDPSTLPPIDGMDMWDALSFDLDSNRTTVLHNIDDVYGVAAVTVNQWKVVTGATYNGTWDSWYGPSGRDDPVLRPYDVSSVLGSAAGKAAASVGVHLTADQVWSLRELAEVKCGADSEGDRGGPAPAPACRPLQAPCLFNVATDPCERRNLAARFPAVLQHVRQILQDINATAVPPGNLPWDPRADPQLWDHTWTNFGDYETEHAPLL